MQRLLIRLKKPWECNLVNRHFSLQSVRINFLLHWGEKIYKILALSKTLVCFLWTCLALQIRNCFGKLVKVGCIELWLYVSIEIIKNYDWSSSQPPKLYTSQEIPGVYCWLYPCTYLHLNCFLNDSYTLSSYKSWVTCKKCLEFTPKFWCYAKQFMS